MHARLHEHAFWVCGIVLSLGIREALVRSIPDIILDPTWVGRLATWRLLLFLGMAVRFYFGSALFFEDFYTNPSRASANTNYGMDFCCGFIHLLIFFAWSTAIPERLRLASGTSYYLMILTVVLLWDLVWLSVSYELDTSSKIRVWATLNAVTFLASAALFCWLRGSEGVVFSEEVALAPVGLATIIDLWEMMRGATPVSDWIMRMLFQWPRLAAFLKRD